MQDIDTILGKVLDDPRVDSVVIATRGPQYLSGTGYGPAEADYKVPPIMRAGADTVSEPAQVFAQGLQATVARLQQRGIRVTFLLQPPEQGVSPSGCLMRPITLGHRGDKCFVRMQDYAARMAPYRALVLELAATLASLHIADPEPLLCADGACFAMRHGRLLYADDNHLSVSGSQLVAPLVVQQALQGLPR